MKIQLPLTVIVTLNEWANIRNFSNIIKLFLNIFVKYTLQMPLIVEC